MSFKKLITAILISATAITFSACGKKSSAEDDFYEKYKAIQEENGTASQVADMPVSTTTAPVTTVAATADTSNPVMLEYHLNYDDTIYKDGQGEIKFAMEEPMDGSNLRDMYPDVQHISYTFPSTQLIFKVGKSREEAIVKGLKIKFETNDMLLVAKSSDVVTYGGHVNGLGYYTNFEWTYNNSLTEENFEVWFNESALIGKNPYLKVTIYADGYKNKTFNIKIKRSENYYYNKNAYYRYTFMDYVDFVDRRYTISDLESIFGPVYQSSSLFDAPYSNAANEFWVEFENCPVTFYFTSTMASPDRYYISGVFANCYNDMTMEFSNGYGWIDYIELGFSTTDYIDSSGHYLTYDEAYGGGKITYISVDGRNIQLEASENGTIHAAYYDNW